MPILHDVPLRDYLAMPGVHFSTLRHMATSPLHYLRACDRERADTPALRLGRLTHALILTPELPAEVALWEGKARRGRAWEEFRAEAAGKTIALASEIAAAERMRDAVYAEPEARALLAEGRGEVTVTWKEGLYAGRVERADHCFHGDHAACDGVNGCGCVCHGQPDTYRIVPCRARPDWLGAAGLVELKTTRFLAPRAWGREAAARHYHVQLAHYLAGLRSETGGGAPVSWIVVENTEPHDVAVCRVGPDQIEAAERVRIQWLQRVAECEAAGRWPGVGSFDFEPPDYVMTEGLEDVDMTSMGESEAEYGQADHRSRGLGFSGEIYQSG